MNNFKKISKRAGINPSWFHHESRERFQTVPYKAGLLILLALWCSGVLVLSASAVPAQGGDRAILGREGNNGMVEEIIALSFKPGEDNNVRSEIESGARVVVLDKSELEAGTFYLVIEITEGIGRMGWVAEDYIHEVLPKPPQE